MAEKFKTILTKKGLEKLAEATATGVPLDIYQIAVGDSNGNYYEPTEEQVKLINEVGRFELNALMIEADNKKRFSAEVRIPESSGGYTIREAGLFDRAGEMIAVAKVPETFKPSVESGAGSQLYFKMIGEYTNDVNITISISQQQLFITDDIMRNFYAGEVLTEVNRLDAFILTEAKEFATDSDTALAQSVNTALAGKSAVNHGHALTDTVVSGILPINKGGTGVSTFANSNLTKQLFPIVHSELSYLYGLGSTGWGSDGHVHVSSITVGGNLKYPNYGSVINYPMNTTNYAPADGWIRFALSGNTRWNIDGVEVAYVDYPSYTWKLGLYPIKYNSSFSCNNTSAFFINFYYNR